MTRRDTPGEGDDGAGADDHRIHRRQIDPDPTNAEYDLLEHIAELEGCSVEDLPPLYHRVDHLVEHLFENPPSPRAQAQLQFSYYGYRIDLDQRGHVSLMKQSDQLELDG